MTLRARDLAARVVICADDDHRTPGNPGFAKAAEAAAAVGAKVAVPEFKGTRRAAKDTDFNDMKRRFGRRAVSRAIAAAKTPAPADLKVNKKGVAHVRIYNEKGKRRPQIDILTDIGRTHELIHDGGREPYARVRNDDHVETWHVLSSTYREILGREYYRLTGSGANRNALADAATNLAAMAKFDGPCAAVYCRVGDAEGRIAIDTGWPEWECILVSKRDWRVSHEGVINFQRSGKPAGFPKPSRRSGRRFRKLLRKYINVAPEDEVLVAAWLLAALRPRGPYPIALLVGEQGSGKSCTSRALKALTDPSAVPLRPSPKDAENMVVGAMASWVYVLDNLSGAQPEISDALCRLSTGGGFSARRFYTNTEEVLIEVQRPAILNGIDDLASRPDLAERCIHIVCPVIRKRRTEQDLNAEFARDSGALFGALLDALSLALRRVERVEVVDLPRMADFAQWAAAGLPALGFKEGEFLQAYRRNQQRSIDIGLDTSVVARALRNFVEPLGRWEGSGIDLLAKLAKQAPEHTTLPAWPRSVKGFYTVLRRLAPSLRAVGIEYAPVRTAAGNLIRFTCTRAKNAPQPPQPPRKVGSKF